MKMPGKLVVIKPDGSTEEEYYQRNLPPLEQLQRLCGGYVEQIPVMVSYEGRKCACFADEEGKLKSRIVNHHASRLCVPHLIVGNLVVQVPLAKEEMPKTPRTSPLLIKDHRYGARSGQLVCSKCGRPQEEHHYE